MNPSLLCLVAVVATGAPPEVQFTIYRPRSDFTASLAEDDLSPLLVRAQDSPFFGGEPPPVSPGAPGGTPGTYAPGSVVPFPGGVPPLVSPDGSGITGDPWLGGGTLTPSPDPLSTTGSPLYTFGPNGPQPYRFGWNSRHDLSFLPREGTTPDVGRLGIFAYDYEMELITPAANNWVMSLAPQFNYRAWEGPRGTPGAAGLPGSAFRFGLGLKLVTPDYGGWNVEFGFNPAIATDFGSSLTSDGVLLDAHAVLFWRTSPTWMWAVGAAFWDRVDDLIVPYAGAVWTPNSVWEFRLLFPQPRVTAFLGTPFGLPTWAYAAGEYHVEAYQVDVEPIGVDTQVQFADWRVLGGLRWETEFVTAFVEAGWVFEREVDFKTGTDFDLSDGFIGRVGFRY